MSEEQAAILRPETLIEEFKKNGVTHIITIPDSETNYLYELMKEQPWLDVIPTSREGETFAIALGLLVSGKVPVCLIQNTHDGIRRFHPGHGAGFRFPAGYGSRIPRVDSSRGDHRLGGSLHRAVPECLPYQLLPGRVE